jgi:hypothetical protein
MHRTRAYSFAVDAVEPATTPMWAETLGASLARRFQRRILVLSEGAPRGGK